MALENPTPAPVETPAAPAASPSPAATAPEPSPGPLSPQIQTPPPAPEPERPGVRESLKGLGLSQFESYADDQAALRALAEQARQVEQFRQQAEQLRELAQVGRQVYPQLSEFQKWQAEQDKSRKAAEAEKARWWNPPEYDPRWAQLIERDPQTGELKPRPGAPLNIVDKYRAAIDHSTSFLEKFAFDPIGSIKPGIEEVAKGLIEQAVESRIGEVQERLAAKDLLAQNAAWMYQADPQSGRPALTPYGQVYAERVRELEQRGVRDITLQNEAARDKAMLALLADQVKSLQAQIAGATPAPGTPALVPTPAAPPLTPAAAQAEANEQFKQRRGMRKPSQSNPATTTDTPIPEGAPHLQQALLAALAEEGYSSGSKLVAV